MRSWLPGIGATSVLISTVRHHVVEVAELFSFSVGVCVTDFELAIDSLGSQTCQLFGLLFLNPFGVFEDVHPVDFFACAFNSYALMWAIRASVATSRVEAPTYSNGSRLTSWEQAVLSCMRSRLSSVRPARSLY